MRRSFVVQSVPGGVQHDRIWYAIPAGRVPASRRKKKAAVVEPIHQPGCEVGAARRHHPAPCKPRPSFSLPGPFAVHPHCTGIARRRRHDFDACGRRRIGDVDVDGASCRVRSGRRRWQPRAACREQEARKEGPRAPCTPARSALLPTRQHQPEGSSHPTYSATNGPIKRYSSMASARKGPKAILARPTLPAGTAS